MGRSFTLRPSHRPGGRAGVNRLRVVGGDWIKRRERRRSWSARRLALSVDSTDWMTARTLATVASSGPVARAGSSATGRNGEETWRMMTVACASISRNPVSSASIHPAGMGARRRRSPPLSNASHPAANCGRTFPREGVVAHTRHRTPAPSLNSWIDMSLAVVQGQCGCGAAPVPQGRSRSRDMTRPMFMQTLCAKKLHENCSGCTAGSGFRAVTGSSIEAAVGRGGRAGWRRGRARRRAQGGKLCRRAVDRRHGGGERGALPAAGRERAGLRHLRARLRPATC